MKNRLYLAAALCGLLATMPSVFGGHTGLVAQAQNNVTVSGTVVDENGFHPNWNLANVHDPSVAYYDGYYYMFGTSASYGNEHDKATIGRQYQGKRSKDLVNWTHVYGPMSTAPAWVKDSLNNIRGRMDLPAIEGSIGSVTAGGTNFREGPGTGYHSIERLDRRHVRDHRPVQPGRLGGQGLRGVLLHGQGRG